MWLKQSMAATIKLGPFLDSVDGVTAETSLTISQADIRLSKNGGANAQTNNAAGATHDELGEYSVPLDTTDTNTLGRLKISVHKSGALPVWQDVMVVPAQVWDSLFGADKLQVHADEITAGLITAAAIATNAFDADAVAADAVTKIQNGLATATALGTVDTVVDAILLDTAEIGTAGAGLTAVASQASVNTIDDFLDTEIADIKAKTDLIPASPAATGDIPNAASIADAVWDEDATGHTTAGTFGEQAKTDIDTLVTQVGVAGAGLTALASQASVNTIDDFLDTEIATLIANVAAILAQTGTTGVTLSTAQMQALADIVLTRGTAGLDNTAALDSIYEAIGMLLRGNTSTGDLVIKETDGVTTFNTRPTVTNPAAVPIVGIG